MVEQALQNRDPNDSRPLVVLAADQGRFGRIAQVMRAWSPAGVPPSVGQQLVREYTYAYVAVAPSLGEMAALILPCVNTDMMSLFLEHVAQVFAAYFVIIQVDQASYHTLVDLIIPENIRLIPQPARSSELNPVEHIWDEIREKFFYNRVFETMHEVIDTLSQGLRELMEMPQRLRSLTNFPHLRITF